MNRTITRLALAMCAAATVACGGRDHAESDTAPPPTVTPGEATGTSGTSDATIRVSGCVMKVDPDGYVLTSRDETILRQETGTAGHHTDDKGSAPDEPNRSGDDERLRHAQNPSAEMGRFRLTGDAEGIARHVGREVEVSGRVEHADSRNETAGMLHVEMIDATGPRCDQTANEGR
jgi:hypothetical protein